MFHLIPHTLLAMFILLFSSVTYAAAENNNDEFPGRKLYRSTKYITLADLQKEYDRVVIIDVRSSYEFNTLHINKAINFPLYSSDFITALKTISSQNPGKKIVTYCNGKTCMKSYKAAKKARTYRIPNVYAYDAGIFDWAVANPDRTTLLNITPLDPSKLIPKSAFNSKLIPAKKFMASANTSNGIIVDTREAQQRDGFSLAFGHEKRAPLENRKKIDKVIRLAKSQKRPLYFYDQAGKQVRWLMYYLEAQAVPEYYFMKGGVHAYLKNMKSRY